jgi:hypothetical protein
MPMQQQIMVEVILGRKGDADCIGHVVRRRYEETCRSFTWACKISDWFLCNTVAGETCADDCFVHMNGDMQGNAVWADRVWRLAVVLPAT